MAVRVQVQDEAAQELLQRVGEVVKNPAGPLRASAQTARRLVQDTFRTTTDPWGQRWPRWAPATRTNRLRSSGSGQILLDTGALYNSIDATATADGVEVRVGTEYASYHQFGNPQHRAWGGPVSPLPQRAFLPVRRPGVAEIPAPWWLDILFPLESAIAKAAR